MARQTVAEQLVDLLVLAGVQRIYGVVGDSLNPIVDAVRRTEGIEWMHVRHEEAGAFAAAAEAQVTGKLAVCAGSCGPGNLHLINGLYDAHRSGAPVLAIAAHIPSHQIGTEYFQETHPDRLFVECSHFCEMLSQPNQMPRIARSAIQHAIGRRGVAVLTIPGDIADLPVKAPIGKQLLPNDPPTMRPCDSDVDALSDAIDAANRVTLFCGAGVAGAHAEVLALAEKIAAPVGHTLRGKEWIQYDNPFDVGMTGLLGYGACHTALQEADLLLLLGTDFPYDQFLPGDVRTVQVDIAPERLGRRTALDLAVQGDVAETLRALLPKVAEKTERSFVTRLVRTHHDLMSKVVGAYTKNVETKTPIHPEYAAAVLDEVAADDAVFTVDTGMCNVWAARYITPNGRRRVLGSFIHGSMANAMPHAIGAQLAAPGRQVISMSGDGGLSMLLGDLITLRDYELPVKIVVFNNSTLGMVKLEMMVDGLPSFGTDVRDVDYAAVARALGMHGVRAEKPSDIRPALTEAFRTPGPALVDIITDPLALSLPPEITGEQIRGFALAASKTILNGGAGEAVRMARSNLRNLPWR